MICIYIYTIYMYKYIYENARIKNFILHIILKYL